MRFATVLVRAQDMSTWHTASALFLCAQLTVADIGFFWIWDLLQDVRPPMQMMRPLDMAVWRAANYPAIEKHFQHVATQPRIKAWTAKSAAH